MPVTPVSGASNAAATAKPADATAKKATGVNAGNGLDTNSFLQLLVTQLKYQNPSEPMDPSQLMNSTAQLTMVDKINELIALQKTDSKLAMASLAGALVGKNVTYVDASAGGKATTGLVQGARIDGDTLMLRINGKDIDFTTVSEIASAA
jgi:flagellar basal-body rod modification protein FlgD